MIFSEEYLFLKYFLRSELIRWKVMVKAMEKNIDIRLKSFVANRDILLLVPFLILFFWIYSLC